ncbi:MAG TPA: CBS domain-containing protein [Chitinophagaceae bacterium]|nr:CBS domain-containing protein [Chitinophagaceae bacterium]
MNSVSICSDAIVIEALALMESENLDYVVVTENNSCVGVMSETDYTHKIILGQMDAETTRVKDIMTQCIHAVDINESVLKCLELMDSFKIRHLLVFEGFLFKGVITLHDLMHAFAKENPVGLQELEKASYQFSCAIAGNQQHYYNLKI